jgi:starch-binding outer membrane protein, SusD/RagB family
MKKKLLYIIVAILSGCLLNSCEKKLDIAPLNILTAEQVFASEDAVVAYLASLYSNMQKEDFGFTTASYLGNCTDEAITNNGNQVLNIGDGTNCGWWSYSNVRYVNDLLVKLPAATISVVSKTTITGEAYFLRGYYYFSMVKRYGGIPIVKKVLTYTGDNLAELQVPRNKEQEVYDFIASDLDSAAMLLPVTNQQGRATKGAALALKARAMLYAASSARYGTVQLGGILGIPATDASKYYQAAYDAANAIMTSGTYSLYSKYTDKATNFQNLFLDVSNPESIFAEYWLYGYKTHVWDCMMIPYGIRGPNGFSSYQNPTLDMVEQYENIDGTPGTLTAARIGTPAAPVFYTNAPDLFANSDPRLLATVLVPKTIFKGLPNDMQSGLYDLGVKVEAGDYAALYNPVTHAVDAVNGTIHIVGASGPGSTEKTQTGFGLKKYLDPNLAQALVVNSGTTGSTQPYIMFRYGEVLLNYAEAAVELGKITDARTAMNLIRARAGIVALVDADITVAKVRHERNVELAFENQRWWDYRRWRQSDVLLNNWWPRMLKTYLDLQKNAYRFEIGTNAGRYAKTFDPKVYYERITPSELTLNPKLVQNPGY